MPGVPEQARGRVGFVGVGLEADTSLRSLDGTRVGPQAIEGPWTFAGVCAIFVRVMGGKASHDRGGSKLPPSTYAWEYPGLTRPGYAVWIGLAWLPTTRAKPGLLLCQLRPRAIAGIACSGNRCAPLLGLDGQGGRQRGSWSLSSSASRGGLRPPRTPPQSSGPVGTLLHWWLSAPGALLHSSRCSSPDSPRKRGGRESFALPRLQSWAPLVGWPASGPILVHRRRFSGLAPLGRPREPPPLLSHPGELRSPRPPPIVGPVPGPPPLGVGAGFTFGKSARRSVLSSRP